MEKIVFLTTGSPYPLLGARKIRDAQMIHLLSQISDVEIVFCSDSPQALQFENESFDYLPENVTLTSLRPTPSTLFKQTMDRIKPTVTQGYDQSIAHALKARAKKGKILWISRLRMAQYVPLARVLGYKVVLDEHQVESSVLLSTAFSSPKHWPEGIRAAQCAVYEQKFCSASHAVVTASEIDAYRLQKLAPKIPVHIIPHAVDEKTYLSARSLAGNSRLFFGALNYQPNHEGLLWFSHEVLPRLKAALGSNLPRIIVSGTDAPANISSKLNSFGIETYSEPSSLLSLLCDAAVVFFPLKSGRGNRINILEAMAAGRAIVSTGKGADGLVLKPTYDISIAEHPDTFTTAILRLLRDPALRSEIGEHASSTVQERFDWQACLPLLDKLIREIRS